MFLRGPAIVLSFVLGAAALVSAPALASDGRAAKDDPAEVDRDRCNADTSTRAKLKVDLAENNSLRLVVIGTVWSNDTDVWEWKLRHNGEVSDSGRSRGSEDASLSFRVNRTMLNGYGVDDIVFRAENLRSGEVCRTVVNY